VHQHESQPPALPAFIPPVTEADREAAFPDVDGHRTHETALRWFVLLDQLEFQRGDTASNGSWDAKGWVGGDLGRLWFRTEGEGAKDRLGDAQLHVLYGRPIGRWWDVVAGMRQDARPGPQRTWAAIGVQGLAPYWFEVEATAYVGAGGRTHFRVEVEYELLLTNRLIVQPLLEVEVYGKADPDRRIDAGVTKTEAGLRLRYEVRRELAPYLGVSWERRHFGTADAARATGEVADARLVFGVRVWQ
jgi:copper resistance protein B